MNEILAALLFRRRRRRRNAQALTIDTPGRIVEERFVELGGMPQWIGIRGEDREHPILLLLHGGPGMPYSSFTPLLRSWERHFVVVQWDQRGAGKTFGRNGKVGSGALSFDRTTEDAIELVELLCRELQQPKVILLASSAGSISGVRIVQRRPDLFHAYVGTDQNVHMLRAETSGYQRTLERLRSAGHKRGVAALTKIGPDPSRWDLRAWTKKQRWLVATDPRADLTQLFLPSLLSSPGHGLRDQWNVLAGLQLCQTRLFDELMAHDARLWGTRFSVPFFLFHGDQDPFTPLDLAEEYFAEVEAPIKEAARVEGAGHLAALRQPGRFLELLLRVRPLALTASGTRRARLG